VVDDEETILRMISDSLEPLGYTILTAASGEEALRLWQERGDTIDMLITDVVMPGMNGRQLATRLLASRPDLPIIFMSGYTDKIIARKGIEELGGVFLAKPILPSTLTATLQKWKDGLPLEGR